jgi:hypothetical protein
MSNDVWSDEQFDYDVYIIPKSKNGGRVARYLSFEVTLQEVDKIREILPLNRTQYAGVNRRGKHDIPKRKECSEVRDGDGNLIIRHCHSLE